LNLTLYDYKKRPFGKREEAKGPTARTACP